LWPQVLNLVWFGEQCSSNQKKISDVSKLKQRPTKVPHGLWAAVIGEVNDEQCDIREFAFLLEAEIIST